MRTKQEGANATIPLPSGNNTINHGGSMDGEVALYFSEPDVFDDDDIE